MRPSAIAAFCHCGLRPHEGLGAVPAGVPRPEPALPGLELPALGRVLQVGRPLSPLPDRQMSPTGKCRQPANVVNRQMSGPAKVRPANVATGRCRDQQMYLPAKVTTGKSQTGRSETGRC